MQDRYREWIAQNVEETYGKCQEVTEAMAAAFPDLIRVRGHYYCFLWGERAHWWLVDEAGDIVDPTAAQFPSKGAGEYVPWDESAPVPTGMCPNCGELVYGGESVCSEACGTAYVAYCTRGL